MYSLRVLCLVVLCVTVSGVDADCPFAATINWVKPCDGKQANLIKITNPSITLKGDHCDAFLNGCIVTGQSARNASAKWIAWKDGTKLHEGSKTVCSSSLGSLKADCPIEKGYRICARDEKVVNPVGQALHIWRGVWKISFTITAPNGESQCVEGEGRLHDKK